MANNSEMRSYDIGASESAQANFESVASRLEALISQRDSDVRNAMSQYQADGVSDEYQAKEARWNKAATEVRSIITTLRNSMQSTDETASTALTQAKSAVDQMG
ncbi:pore-forming ESAT-6 family protein [Actinomyces trachealis]|uniref:pore-forming ESAT-6 family protein n=1 Tax=Actinomyces trachealis TaxID=2763540 RepID=UPI001892C50A|nr:pore-forming ESAT-6 family protein [Actinomyces trachealis]